LTNNLPYYQPKQITKKQTGLRVGISLLYFIPNPKRNFRHLVNGIVSFINTLPEDAEILLLPMLVSPQTDHDDLWASEQVQAKVLDRKVRIVAAQSVASCIATMRDLDFVVAARLHANILATLSGTPCLGISYRPKVASFFRENGLEEYCIDITELDQLEPTFVHMLSQETKVRRKFRAVSKQNLQERSVYQAFIDRHF
jgi:polysaccharide pyruvyl transferase WcaK-like protein